jgi:hypothetical protein
MYLANTTQHCYQRQLNISTVKYVQDTAVLKIENKKPMKKSPSPERLKFLASFSIMALTAYRQVSFAIARFLALTDIFLFRVA